jgi:hypothetical protein
MNMARQMQHADMVRHYIDLIQLEKKKLEEALENISEYAALLKQATDDTQQRLIGRHQ